MVRRFAGLAKKVWNPRLFKSQVSPHEFLQEVNRASAGKFRLEVQGDPVEFLGWLLNKLHKDMGGTKKKNSSEFLFFFRVGRLGLIRMLIYDMKALFSLRSRENSSWRLSKSSFVLTQVKTRDPCLI